MKAKALNEGTPLQPKVFVIGTLDECIGCVIVDNIKYIFNEPLEAVDTCFKIFWVLNLEYPSECNHCWLFIQKAVHQINGVVKNISAGVETLIKDLQHV